MKNKGICAFSWVALYILDLNNSLLRFCHTLRINKPMFLGRNVYLVFYKPFVLLFFFNASFQPFQRVTT